MSISGQGAEENTGSRPGHPDALDWLAVKVAFDEALALPASDRAGWLAAQAAAGWIGAAEFDEISSLLAHESMVTDGPAELLDTPVALWLDDWTRTDDAEHPPDLPLLEPGLRLGAWEIVAELGRGGMAEVWRARRADGAWTGEAAIKVLKRGMDSAAVLQRFALEQQALARLVHPHIARLLDAGRTPLGLPYFVMEQVHGLPIDQACQGLSIEQRLALFLQLADAVSFAHRQLLVHRDLKPSNVMVDAQGQVKLLDFGIAKALDPLEGSASANDLTQAGSRPFTPNYASPEQARGEWVGTATDIYSLGVLLYVMLTGLRPYGRQASTPQEAVRSLLEDDPTRPSALSPQEVPDPHWLQTRRRLRGDLDNILLKALEKSTERRYVSVDALAADVRAFLGGFPVSAQPASWLYLGSKFVSRHRWPVALSSLALLSLLASTSFAFWQAHRAETALGVADARLGSLKQVLKGVLVRFTYGVWLAPKGSTLLTSFVDETLPTLEKALQQAPDDAELKAIAADLYSRLAELLGSHAMGNASGRVSAEQMLRTAVQLGDEVLPRHLADGALVARIATARCTLAQLLQGQARLDEAEQHLVAGLRDVQAAQALPQSRADQAFLLGARGSLHLQRGQLLEYGGLPSRNQPDAALREHDLALADFAAFIADREGIAAIDAESPPGDIDTAASVLQAMGTAHSAKAVVEFRRGDLNAARLEAQQAVAVYQDLVDHQPPNLIFKDGLMTASNLLGQTVLRLGDAPAALAATRRAWTLRAEMAASEGPQSKWAGLVAWVGTWYGGALQQSGQTAAAIPVLRQAADLWQTEARAAGAAPAAAVRAARLGALSQLFLARARLEQGQTDAARTAWQQAQLGVDPWLAGPKTRSRDLLALQAELHLLRGELARRAHEGDAGSWTAQARSAVEEAAALGPLATDQQQLRARLNAP